MSYDVETHAHEPHKTGHGWVDMVVAFSALAVSVISLGVAIFHGRTMEEMAKANARLVEANSWPFLQANLSNTGANGALSISLGVANAGVGPAKIHWLEMYYKGRPLTSLRRMVLACCGEQEHDGHLATPLFFAASVVRSGVLRAGETTSLYTLPRTRENAVVWDRLNKERLNMSYRTCYCSVFDECWVSDLTSLTPQVVKACPAPTYPFDPFGR